MIADRGPPPEGYEWVQGPGRPMRCLHCGTKSGGYYTHPPHIPECKLYVPPDPNARTLTQGELDALLGFDAEPDRPAQQPAPDLDALLAAFANAAHRVHPSVRRAFDGQQRKNEYDAARAAIVAEFTSLRERVAAFEDQKDRDIQVISRWSEMHADAEARATAAEARVAELEAALHMVKRMSEMSASIMRDARRTGAWEGAERVARQFDRIAVKAALNKGGTK